MAINDAIAGAQQPQAQPATQPDASAADASTTSPQEQEAYEKVVLAGIQVLSDPATSPPVMAMLADEQGGEPAKRLAKATSSIITQLDEQSGGTIPEVVIIPAAGEILLNVAEFASESKSMQVDDQIVGKAGQFLLMDLADAYDFSSEDMQALMGDMSEDEMRGMVAEQDVIANSGAAPEAAASAPAAPAAVQAPAAQPAQKLPGIINQTIGG